MAKRDDVLRKLQRQGEAVPAAPTVSSSQAEEEEEEARGHQPAPGTRKVTVNLRVAVWGPDVWDGAEGAMGLRQRAEEAGVPPVAVIEALVLRYLADDKLRDRVNVEASRVVRDRRQLAAQIRRLHRADGG